MSDIDETNDEFENEDPLEGVMKVGELIKLLKKFDQNLPILGAYSGRVRPNEYFSIYPTLSNLNKQETGGDPEFYGSAPCVLIGCQR